MYGLKTAALAKGATAIGARLTIDQLKTNYMVVLSINGVDHFEVVRNITNSTVYLFDPNLGNIEMTRDKFNELYTGIALIINDQAPANATILTDDEMRNIKASGYKTVKIGAWYEPPRIYYTVRKVYHTRTIRYITLDWISIYDWGPIHIGFWWPTLHAQTIRYCTYQLVRHYILGKWHPIYVRRMMSDETARKHVSIQTNVISLIGSAGGIGVARTAVTRFAALVGLGQSTAQFGLDLPSGGEIYHAFMDPYVEVDFDGYIIPIRPGL